MTLVFMVFNYCFKIVTNLRCPVQYNMFEIYLPVGQLSQMISFDLLPQALGYICGIKKVEIPDVVEREIVRDDGTVVRRFVWALAHACVTCVV